MEEGTTEERSMVPLVVFKSDMTGAVGLSVSAILEREPALVSAIGEELKLGGNCVGFESIL